MNGATMRMPGVVWVFCAFFLITAGCASSGGESAYEAGLRERLSALGLTDGAGRVRWWQDPAKETVFVVGSQQEHAREHYSLVILRKDRAEPTVLDLRGIDLARQWVDSDGKVWSVPGFVSAEEKARMTVWSIDESSGLFIMCNLRQSSHPLSVGRMNNADGWVFSDTLPPQVKSAVYVRERGSEIVVSEAWSFKVHGPRELRPYHWVYSPDPSAAGGYRRTDSFR